VAVVAAGVTNAERMFGPKQPGMLGPVAFLLLFVFSALVTGTLVLLPPVRLYLDGHKTEGVRLLLYTAGWLGVITILMLIVIVAVG
jgi:hypothetical protein